MFFFCYQLTQVVRDKGPLNRLSKGITVNQNENNNHWLNRRLNRQCTWVCEIIQTTIRHPVPPAHDNCRQSLQVRHLSNLSLAKHSVFANFYNAHQTSTFLSFLKMALRCCKRWVSPFRFFFKKFTAYSQYEIYASWNFQWTSVIYIYRVDILCINLLYLHVILSKHTAVRWYMTQRYIHQYAT